MTTSYSSPANIVGSADVTTHSTAVQSQLFQFDIIESQIVGNSYSTTTKKLRFHYKHRRGFKTDVFDIWRAPEQIENSSRADISRAYRLSRGF